MSDSPQILLIETSGEVCSIALARGQEIVAEKAVYEANSHSNYLAGMVKELMDEAKINYDDLQAVAIAGGPGSYTGLRIGCSLAKGICFGAGIPLIACSTLKGIAAAAIEQTATSSQIISLVDARRMDAYVGVFNSNLELEGEEFFTTLDDEFKARYQNRSLVASGSGAAKWLEENPDLDIEFVETKLLARHMLFEALNLFESQSFVDVAYYEPNYIKSVYVTKPKPKL